VIIPTRDRPQDLLRCLRSVAALDYPDFEVIVVDQSHSDEGQKLAEGLNDPRIRVIRTTTTGRARGANIGIKQASGEIVAFTDDDITVPPDWLHRLAHVFTSEPNAGVYFGAVTAPAHDPEECFVPVFSPKSYRLVKSRAEQSPSSMGANMALSRKALAKAGGFDPLMGVGSDFKSGEDWELAYRVMKAGFLLVEDPEVALTHYGARGIADGQADRLIMSAFFGFGAGYLRNVRRGDVKALWLFAREVAAWAWQPVINLVSGRRPLGVRRVFSVLQGARAAAFRRGPSAMA
jgi:GT2 family glycosyltransferase